MGINTYLYVTVYVILDEAAVLVFVSRLVFL